MFFCISIETRPFSFESVLEIAVGTIRISGVVDVAVIFVVVVVMVVEVVVRGNVEVVVKIGQLCSSDESSQSRFPSHLLCDSIHSLELTHRNCHWLHIASVVVVVVGVVVDIVDISWVVIISGDEGLNVTGITGGMMTSHPWCPFSGLNYYVTFRLRQCYVKCYLDSKS